MMTKKEEIISLYPKYLDGELSFKEICEKVGCTLDNVYKTINPVFYKRKEKNTDSERLEFAHSINEYVDDKAKTIADWSKMTEEEKNEYK